MLESPRNRINGTDEFMVQRSAARILEEMQKSGWTQGEAELLPKYLESAIKQNSERIRKLKPCGYNLLCMRTGDGGSGQKKRHLRGTV